ncbi:MAG: asparagine synthase (glutamine-hydrolyzing) [Agrobacterium sp.]|jgi:asparagine synthase (glutamine-hydrolysing)|nr:asparagine synthase (glutamine-hydrolyzing) [Agrobacterium sp.]
MCGIAGYLNSLETPAESALLSRMAATLAHRGPDATGMFTAPGLGLAHARLSIVDIAGGAQPMSLPDGGPVISFNGEIFNHIELREDLMQRGRCVRTHSDTEVILHLYELYGADCVQHLNGDFAFALWDRRLKRLMLARDRIGVRPLYYARRSNGLFFGSEIKALFAVPGIVPEPDPLALDQIFTLWFPLAPRTSFKDILELPPGHVLLAQAGREAHVSRYWQPSFPDADEARAPCDEAAVKDELAALLTDAVRIRLRADRPCGAYLSGGLDSSLIAALAARQSPEPLSTFSVTFEAADFDESAAQQTMAVALGTQHSALCCPFDAIAALLPEVIRHAEQPLPRTGPVPLYMLAAHVRKSGVKAVLTGEGADEVFAGYDIFKEAKLRRFAHRQPGSRRRPLLFQRLYPYLPRLSRQSPAYLSAFFSATSDMADPLYSHQPRFRLAAGTKVFFSRALGDALKGYDVLDDLRSRLPEAFHRWHALHQAQYLEMTGLLPGYILSSQGDRMSMAHGVEGRYPFLDPRLVDFAARIPPRLKLKGLTEKHNLRDIAADLLPPEIRNRPKQPYRAPDAALLRPSGPVPQALSEAAIRREGLFDPAATARLVRKLQSQSSPGTRDAMALTGILSTQLWREQFPHPSGEKEAPLREMAGQ